MKHPDSMNKTQLKEELIAHGVTLPTGNVLKATYIELYNTHILKNMDISAEDKSSSKSKNTKTSVKKRKAIKPETQEFQTKKSESESDKVFKANLQPVVALEKFVANETSLSKSGNELPMKAKEDKGSESARRNKEPLELLQDLSDSEIRTRLKNLGHTVGPINASTRKVYLKKLAKSLESGDTAVNGQHDNEEEHSEPTVIASNNSSSRRRILRSSVPEEAVLVPSSRSTRSRNKAPAATQTTDRSSDEQQKTEPTVEQRNVEKEEARSSPVSKPKTIKPERRWIPIWVQIIVTILLVLFVYIVVYTMEKNPSPLKLPHN